MMVINSLTCAFLIRDLVTGLGLRAGKSDNFPGRPCVHPKTSSKMVSPRKTVQRRTHRIH